MKWAFVCVLATLLVAAALASAMAYDPGYILITYGLYTIETSLWVGLAALFFWLVLCYFLAALLYRGVRQSGRLARWRSERRQRRAHRETNRGIIALIEGRFDKARKLLVRAAKHDEEPLIPYLMAARASAGLDDDDRTREYLRLAEQSTTGATVAVELTQAELQLQRDQLEQCLATLTRARQQGSPQPRVLALLSQVYERLGEWDHLLQLLPELRSYPLRSAEELATLERRAWLARIDGAGQARDLALLSRLWTDLPKGLERDSAFVERYAGWLITLGDGASAAQPLTAQLKREWQPELAYLYGLAEGDAARQLTQVERWLQEHGNDAALLLTAGRLAGRNSLWGKARGYLERSIGLDERPETCEELAQVLDQLGEGDRSIEVRQRGLRAATPAGTQATAARAPRSAAWTATSG